LSAILLKVARAKLVRDLPLGRTLSGSEKVISKNGAKTLIELNLALRSLDLVSNNN